MGFKEWNDNLKQKALLRIQEGSVISEIEGQTVYLKKSRIPLLDEWRAINPIVNEDSNGLTWNFGNFIFGGWRNFVKLILVFILIGFVLFQFNINFNTIEALREACPITVNQSLIG